MTLRTSSRLAGATYLLYIVVGIADMVVYGRATKAEGTAATLSQIALHETAVRASVLLGFATFPIAVALAVALWALTRDEDRELATMALVFRATEGALAAVASIRTLALLSLATPAADASAIAAADALMKQGNGTFLVASTTFAMGSTLFCWLFLRARSIPVPLAWLGVGASFLLLVALPVRILGLLPDVLSMAVWAPMLVFELTFAVWLIVRGVAIVPTR
jgi:uncharacterized protein DUF4386